MSIKQWFKIRWQIENDWDFWMIMLTFSFAGSSLILIRKVLFPILNIPHHLPVWEFLLYYIPVAFILYQISLLIFGALLGQFKFFWEWEKKMVCRLIGRKNIKH